MKSSRPSVHRPFLPPGLILTALGLTLFAPCFGRAASADTSILPVPQEVESLPGGFKLDSSVVIALPLEPSPHDLFLAQSLASELAQRYGLALRTERMMALPAGPVIALGTGQNPLIQEAERKFPLDPAKRPAAEGYSLLIQPGILVVEGCDEAGAFYGLQSVRQLLSHAEKPLELPGLRIHDWPYKPLRGVKLYLPGRDNIGFYKRFISDFMALYKLNTVFVEIDGAMRFDRHPEINAGWIDLFKDLQYTRRLFARGVHDESVDSPNQDVADGGVLEKREVADLVSWTRRQHINFVPEMPSLTHSYYLLSRHRELADPTEVGREWPDAYAADNPASRRLLFEVLDEVIEVTKPNMMHIGHDEWQAPLGTAPGTTSEDRRRQYSGDVRAIHDYLAAKGIRTAIYGDELMEAVRGRGSLVHPATKTRAGYAWPGALPPGQVAAEIPKDILVFNWFWREGVEGKGEANDLRIDNWGFQQVFNNFQPDITGYDRRSARKSVIGGVPSTWAATTEFNFGKDMMCDFIGCANLVWSTHWPSLPEMIDRTQAELPVVRQRLSGRLLPSEDGDPVEPLALPVPAGPAADPGWGVAPASLRTGALSVGPLRFQLADPRAQSGHLGVLVGVAGKGGTKLPSESAPIPVGADVSSLIFLHALARPAANEFAYRSIFDFDDSADLMGCYEVVYEDGLVATIPIRYGVNILEWSWARHDKPDSYPLATPVSYGARAVEIGEPGGTRLTFFALEWPNPRLGKKIKEVRLLGSTDFRTAARNSHGMLSNAIILRALSVVRPRAFPGPVRAQTAPEAP